MPRSGLPIMLHGRFLAGKKEFSRYFVYYSDMTGKRAKFMILGLLAGILMLPAAPVFAGDGQGKKPPIIVTQGDTRYIFTTQNDKMRSILLNSKNLRIRHRHDGDYRNDRWRSREKRERRPVRERREYDERGASYDAGYTTGYVLSRD